MEPSTTFEENRIRQDRLARTLSLRHRRFSLFRLLLFLAALCLFFYLFSIKAVWPLTALVVLFPLLFGLLIKKHNRLAYDKRHALFLKQINEEELLRSQGRLSSFAMGDVYQDERHPYTSDLDIFGKNSLYQLLNRCTTDSGRDYLAAWLKQPAAHRSIEERKAAIAELGAQWEWRQHFQASGMHFEDPKSDIQHFLTWAGTPEKLPYGSLLQAAAFALPLIALVLLVLALTIGFSLTILWAILPFSFLALYQVFDRVKQTTEATEASIKALKSYADLIAMIEKADFQATYLTSLQSSFVRQGQEASKAIARLQSLLEKLQARTNLLFGTLNILLLLDIHYLRTAIAWKKKYGGEVSHWFDAIGQYEALCSLAALHFAHPEYAFPEVRKATAERENGDGPYLSAKALGHPMILKEARVSNDLMMEKDGTVLLITGSNMSGKSTFLRTVGVNAVLAMMGAPVCADSMSISVLQLFTGMRSQDNLEENVSSFYAELKRIRQLLDSLEKPELPVLFMLDEVLKGTNSKDRHRGAAALIRQLSSKKAFGFVSTHDLELGELAKELPHTHNYSFNSRIEGDEITFDYRLTPGICKSFNASKLMENMGIILG